MLDTRHPVKMAVADWARETLDPGDMIARDRELTFFREAWAACAEHGSRRVVRADRARRTRRRRRHHRAQARGARARLPRQRAGLRARLTDAGVPGRARPLRVRRAASRRPRPASRGDLIGAFAITEPNSGSDTYAMTTRAERRGDEWVLDRREGLHHAGARSPTSPSCSPSPTRAPDVGGSPRSSSTPAAPASSSAGSDRRWVCARRRSATSASTATSPSRRPARRRGRRREHLRHVHGERAGMIMASHLGAAERVCTRRSPGPTRASSSASRSAPSRPSRTDWSTWRCTTRRPAPACTRRPLRSGRGPGDARRGDGQARRLRGDRSRSRSTPPASTAPRATSPSTRSSARCATPSAGSYIREPPMSRRT